MIKYCPDTSYNELDWKKNFTSDVTAALYRTIGFNPFRKNTNLHTNQGRCRQRLS